MSVHRPLPQASLQEEWSVAVISRWATTFGGVRGGARMVEPVRAEATPYAVPRRAPVARTAALLRLAADERATAHERALAAERAADLLRRTA